MTDLVSVCTSITFENSTTPYILPEELEINPAQILDDIERVYRVSIGKPNITPDEAVLYEPLFRTLDTKIPFASDIHFDVNGNKLTFKMAYIMKTEKTYGKFYDIEAALNEIDYKERN